MDFLAYFWVTVSLFFTSIFGGIFGVQNASSTIATPAEQTPVAAPIQHKQIVADQTSVATTTQQTFTWILFSTIGSTTGSVYYQKNGKIYSEDSFGQENVLDADLATFMLAQNPLTKYFSVEYVRDKNNVYYRSPIDGSMHVVKSADSATFSLVSTNDEFDAEDKNHKYFGGNVICEDVTRKTCERSEYGPRAGHWLQIIQ